MKIALIIILNLFLTICKAQQLAVVKVNGKFGCIDRKGRMVIQPEWDFILQGIKNKQLLVRRDSLFGYMDAKGNIIVKPKYQDANLFSEGLAAVSNGFKYGFINPKGDTIIPFLYDDVFDGFNNGLSDVTLGDSSGYIDKAGKAVIPIKYQTCYPFLSAYAQVETFAGEDLLIDKKGKTYEYDDVSEQHRLWVPRQPYPGSFTTTTGQGRTNRNGDTIVPPIYKVTGNLFDNMHIVEDSLGKWGAYNDKGKLIVEPKYDKMWHFYKGLSSFKLNGKWGFIDKQGRVVIESKFEMVGQFSSGIAYAELNGKAGFINKRGVFVIQPIFETSYSDGFQ